MCPAVACPAQVAVGLRIGQVLQSSAPVLSLPPFIMTRSTALRYSDPRNELVPTTCLGTTLGMVAKAQTSERARNKLWNGQLHHLQLAIVQPHR